MHNAGILRHNCSLLGLSCLKQLFDTGKTLCNIASCHTAGVERSHRQLRTGFTDGLCGNDTDRLTDIDRLAGCKVRAVAMCADTVFGMALNDCTDINLLDSCRDNSVCLFLADHFVVTDNNLTGCGIHDLADCISAHDTVNQRLQYILVFLVDNFVDPCTLCGITLFLTDNHFLRNIHQTSGQVTGVRGTKCGIGQGLTRRTRSHEVLHDIHTFTEVGFDRQFHCLTVGCKHGSAHTGKLPHLCHGTTRTGVRHDLDRVEL